MLVVAFDLNHPSCKDDTQPTVDGRCETIGDGIEIAKDLSIDNIECSDATIRMSLMKEDEEGKGGEPESRF